MALAERIAETVSYTLPAKRLGAMLNRLRRRWNADTVQVLVADGGIALMADHRGDATIVSEGALGSLTPGAFDGALELNPKAVARIAKACKGEDVTLDDDGVIRCGNAVYRPVSGRVDGDLPELLDEAWPKRSLGQIDVDEWRDIVAGVGLAQGQDIHREILCGIFLCTDSKGNPVAVATDTHRLHIAPTKLCRVDKAVVIPTEMAELLCHAQPMDGRIELTESADRIGFVTRSISGCSGILKGTHLNWERVVPTEHLWTLELDAEEALRAIRAASAIASDSANRLRLAHEGRTLVLRARAEESGEVEIPISASLSGDRKPLEFAVNFKYLNDAVLHARGSTIQIRGTEPSRPLTVESNDHPGRKAVVMPMALA
jgi:DNA polymerase III sliding clamp (beta) subunit (PCNA family)